MSGQDADGGSWSRSTTVGSDGVIAFTVGSAHLDRSGVLRCEGVLTPAKVVETTHTHVRAAVGRQHTWEWHRGDGSEAFR